jgi:hypothetical protein
VEWSQDHRYLFGGQKMLTETLKLTFGLGFTPLPQVASAWKSGGTEAQGIWIGSREGPLRGAFSHVLEH